MNTRTAAPVIITVSLVVLMSGCAGAAAQGGSVRDDLSPISANSASVGLARGHVIARDDLSPMNADALRELHSHPVQAESARSFSADARRELHSASPVQALGATAWSADALREFHAAQPVTSERAVIAEAIREFHAAQSAVGVTAAEMQGERLSSYAEARELHSGQVQSEPVQGFSVDVIRELKGSAPVAVRDDLSPLNTRTPKPTPPADTVDDDLSPLGASH